MTAEDLQQLVQDTLARLGEHFHAIQFLGSLVDDDGNTEFLKLGLGLWQARTGMARQFLVEDEAQTKAHYMAEIMNGPDEGENWKKTA